MARNHGYFKCPCIFCNKFIDGQCVELNLRFKKFEVSKLNYVDLEVAIFHGEKGKLTKIFPSMKYVHRNTTCGIYETWLNNEITDLVESKNGAVHVRCEEFSSFDYD